MSYYISILPRDPVVVRDGRPFGKEKSNRMKILDWPYPSVLAGSLRTMIGKLNKKGFTSETIRNLKDIKIAGPLPKLGDQLYVPSPGDFVVVDTKEGRQSLSLRPATLNHGEGCNLPSGLCPLTRSGYTNSKPVPSPAFWSMSKMKEWLSNKTGADFITPELRDDDSAEWGLGFLNAPQKEERIHVVMNPEKGIAEEGGLFMTSGLDFNTNGCKDPLTMTARIETPEQFHDILNDLNTQHPFGGERRLALWRTNRTEKTSVWGCEEAMRQVMKNTKRVRMILVTPAIFKHGWKPDWLNDNLEGSPIGVKSRFKLVSASIARWLPISGWSMEDHGPKAIRRMVPAGSVYFFDVLDGDPSELSDHWMKSVCDEHQDRLDGFGVSLWGVWTPH